MTQPRAFTLTELIASLFIVGSVIFLVALTLQNRGCPARELACRTMCGTRMNGVYKALQQYAVAHHGRFPVYGESQVGEPMTGFREGDRMTGTGAVLTNNITAPLWVLVRDARVHPRSFLCPSTRDRVDPIGQDYSPGSPRTPDSLAFCFDFLKRENLSFSMMNMYDARATVNWRSDAPPDWVFLADNNANDQGDALGRHTHTSGAAEKDIRRLENSPNHGGDGQNVLYGDGHVRFESHPFAGPGDDNIFAVKGAGGNEPPSPSRAAGDSSDVVLMPLHGNGGDSLSGLPLAVDHYRFRTGVWDKIIAGIVLAWILMFVAAWIWLQRRSSRCGRYSVGRPMLIGRDGGGVDIQSV